jgi:hypothetical protein
MCLEQKRSFVVRSVEYHLALKLTLFRLDLLIR